MALEPLATKGNVLHVYDFRVKPGSGEEFIRLFDAFDYSDDNPMQKSPAQVKDGVLCRDVADPNHFYLIGEWRSIEEHKAIRKLVAEMRPAYGPLLEGGPTGLVPIYAEVVSSTPPELLQGKR